MKKKNEFIWKYNNLIKSRCLKCFILFSRIIHSEYYKFQLKYELICNYCQYKEYIYLYEYLKFIKSKNIQIPLCKQCKENISIFININEYTYFCDNYVKKKKYKYKRLKNNFNSFYCKKHNKSFKYTIKG